MLRVITISGHANQPFDEIFHHRIPHFGINPFTNRRGIEGTRFDTREFGQNACCFHSGCNREKSSRKQRQCCSGESIHAPVANNVGARGSDLGVRNGYSELVQNSDRVPGPIQRMRTKIKMEPLDVLSNAASTDVFCLFEDNDGFTGSCDKRCCRQAGNAGSNDGHVVVPHLIACHSRFLLYSFQRQDETARIFVTAMPSTRSYDPQIFTPSLETLGFQLDISPDEPSQERSEKPRQPTLLFNRVSNDATTLVGLNGVAGNRGNPHAVCLPGEEPALAKLRDAPYHGLQFRLADPDAASGTESSLVEPFDLGYRLRPLRPAFDIYQNRPGNLGGS